MSSSSSSCCCSNLADGCGNHSAGQWLFWPLAGSLCRSMAGPFCAQAHRLAPPIQKQRRRRASRFRASLRLARLSGLRRRTDPADALAVRRAHTRTHKKKAAAELNKKPAIQSAARPSSMLNHVHKQRPYFPAPRRTLRLHRPIERERESLLLIKLADRSLRIVQLECETREDISHYCNAILNSQFEALEPEGTHTNTFQWASDWMLNHSSREEVS